MFLETAGADCALRQTPLDRLYASPPHLFRLMIFISGVYVRTLPPVLVFSEPVHSNPNAHLLGEIDENLRHGNIHDAAAHPLVDH